MAHSLMLVCRQSDRNELLLSSSISTTSNPDEFIVELVEVRWNREQTYQQLVASMEARRISGKPKVTGINRVCLLKQQNKLSLVLGTFDGNDVPNDVNSFGTMGQWGGSIAQIKWKKVRDISRPQVEHHTTGRLETWAVPAEILWG